MNIKYYLLKLYFFYFNQPKKIEIGEKPKLGFFKK